MALASPADWAFSGRSRTSITCARNSEFFCRNRDCVGVERALLAARNWQRFQFRKLLEYLDAVSVDFPADRIVETRSVAMDDFAGEANFGGGTVYDGPPNQDGTVPLDGLVTIN